MLTEMKCSSTTDRPDRAKTAEEPLGSGILPCAPQGGQPHDVSRKGNGNMSNEERTGIFCVEMTDGGEARSAFSL